MPSSCPSKINLPQIKAFLEKHVSLFLGYKILQGETHSRKDLWVLLQHRAMMPMERTGCDPRRLPGKATSSLQHPLKQTLVEALPETVAHSFHNLILQSNFPLANHVLYK